MTKVKHLKANTVFFFLLLLEAHYRKVKRDAKWLNRLPGEFYVSIFPKLSCVILSQYHVKYSMTREYGIINLGGRSFPNERNRISLK